LKRVADALFAGIFILLLVAVPIATLLSERSHVSFYEQRNLASTPQMTWDGLSDGSYFNQIETVLSDHIVKRDSLVKLNTWCDFKLGKPGVSGIAVTKEALLSDNGYQKWDLSYLSGLADEVGSGLKSLNDEIRSYGGYFCYLGVPLQSTYFASKYPDYMDNRLWDTQAIRASFSAELEKNEIPFVDMHSVYDTLGDPEEYYSKTDHHYTYQGALVAYTSLMNRINQDTGESLRVLTMDDLNFQTLPNTFLGSSNRKLYGLWQGDDKLEIGTLKSPISFTRTDNGEPVVASLYDVPTSSDWLVTYGVYMGGDIGETVIKTNRSDLPNALIFGDSFTNPIETLFWASFNETHSLDLRYYTAESLKDYITQYRPDVVICVRDETVYLSKDGNGKIS
jgi:hypothetical protein